MSGIAALKGFRTQFLYTLYHLLKCDETNLIFRLEGIEDIDLFDEKNNLKTVIQVKNLSKSLTISDLLSNDGTSFVRRCIQIHRNSPTTKSCLISFGEISRELQKLVQSKALASKDKDILRKYNLKESDWVAFKSSTELIEVNENSLTGDILQSLKKQFPTIDPIPTAEILLHWLSYSAEKQESVSPKQLAEKIELTALYLSQRIAAANQVGKYILPLRRVQSDSGTISRLQQEFYMGSNARYEHITNNLDVIRPEFLNEITRQLQIHNVVIIQGASGQGKSTLAYRYIYQHTPEELAYEILAQDDFERTREAILTIAAITARLELPVLFLINVSPNNTSWVKIVQEFSNSNIIRFLIAVRQEDWFKAVSVGISFLHHTVEISFKKDEASVIYDKLNEKSTDLFHADFEEAWVQFGGTGPLLEFVFTVTHGESLRYKLQQQIRILEQEENSGSLTDFLRIICLADTYGAKLAVSQLTQYQQLFNITNRLEKEYLLKVTDDKKYIAGFHPQRSRLLLEYLFDEFIIEKQTYVVKCLGFLEAKDTYYFLLNIFNEQLTTPEKLLKEIHNCPEMNWVNYTGIIKALLWAGIGKYLDDNIITYNESYARFGDAWFMLADVYFGKTLDLKSYLDSTLFSEEIRQFSEEINRKLTPKSGIFYYVEKLTDLNLMPVTIPKDGLEWQLYGELLFWYNQLGSPRPVTIFSKEVYEQAFLLCGTEQLATLMLGMYYYNDFTNEVKLTNSNIFIDKIRRSHCIPEINVSADEITITYLIDLLQEGGNFNMNDRSVEIIELLRRAFPDSKKFTTRGVGHNLDLIPSMHDETIKSISIESLSLEEWTSLNSTLINLFEYRHRPKDWEHFHAELEQWEIGANSKISEFNQSLQNFFKSNANYQLLTPVTENIQYWSNHAVKMPQNITDPLGAYNKNLKAQAKRKTLNIERLGNIGQTEKAALLQFKYESFIRSLSDYKTHLENFLRQSGSALYDRMLLLLNKNVDEGNNVERLSQYNLFKAIEFQKHYEDEKRHYFSKYVNTNEVGDLHASAYLWRSYLTGGYTSKNNSGPGQNVKQLKSDIISRLSKSLKQASKGENFRLSFHLDESTADAPVIMIEADSPISSLASIRVAFQEVKKAIAATDMGLKKLTLDLHFKSFYFLPIIQAYTLNNSWYEFPSYVFESKDFEDLNIFHFTPKPISEQLIKSWDLMDWSILIPKTVETQESVAEFMKFQLFVQHLKDVSKLDTERLDDIGTEIVVDDFNKYAQLIGVSFQKTLNFLFDIITRFGYTTELYLKDEFEKEYQDSLIAIKDHIYPENESGPETQTLRFTLNEMSGWSVRLKICSNKISSIYFLVLGKYIEQYNLEQVNKELQVAMTDNVTSVIDFFKIDFKSVPDQTFTKTSTEKNSAGNTIVNYRKKLDYKECGLFDAILLKQFDNDDYNIIFVANDITHKTVAALKQLTDQLYRIYGIDDLGNDLFATTEGFDLLAGRMWTGRMWFNTEKHDKLPDLLLSKEGGKIELTLFSPNQISTNNKT